MCVGIKKKKKEIYIKKNVHLFTGLYKSCFNKKEIQGICMKTVKRSKINRPFYIQKNIELKFLQSMEYFQNTIHF